MTNKDQLNAHLEAMIEAEVSRRVKEELEQMNTKQHIPAPPEFKTKAIPVKRKRKYVYLVDTKEFIIDYEIGKDYFFPLVEENIDTCEKELGMELVSVKMTPDPLFVFSDKHGKTIRLRLPATEKVVF